MVDTRIAERRQNLKAEQRRRRLRRSLLAVVIISPFAALAVLDATGRLGVETVTVMGASAVSDSEITAAASIQPGDSLVRMSTSAAADRIEALPRVGRADVYRTWRRDVVIEVVERIPVLQAAAGGLQPRWVLIDREGVVIGAGDDASLPEIVLRGAPPSLGAHVGDNTALANAYSVWRGLSGPLRTDVHRYIANSQDELRLELRRGVIINFGRAERIDEKVRAIGAVLADIAQREIVEIDVRAPSRPVVVLPSDPTEDDDNSEPTESS